MKLLTIILVATILIGGTVIGLGYAGVLKISGITPAKKSSAAKESEKSATDATEAEKSDKDDEALESPAPPPVNQVPEPGGGPPPASATVEADVTKRKDGTERLAKLWSSIDIEALKKILLRWDEADLLPVLAKMDDAKLAELLGAIALEDAERAARISKGIKTLEKGGK